MGEVQTILTGFAVVGAWLAALLAWRSGSRATEQKELQGRREEWWRRFQWATELALEADAARSRVGGILLTSLSRSELAGHDELDAIYGVVTTMYLPPVEVESAARHTGFERDQEVQNG